MDVFRTTARTALSIAALGTALSLAQTARALPIGPTLFCDTYPNAPACLGGMPACTYCHAGTPPARNTFGRAVEAALLPGAPRPLSLQEYESNIVAALHAVESSDSDNDGFLNGDEILAGTHPADNASFPDATTCPPFNRNGDWDVCFYDYKYVFKKVRLDFCGASPTWDEIDNFGYETDKPAALQRELDHCLDTAFWKGKNGQLWQLAHRKIRPLAAIKEGEDGGQIPLADYYDDYNLYVWANTDDNDVRDILLADYYVVKDGAASYRVGSPAGEQGVTRDRRAGMLTTRWNLVYNVMFTALPRTAAAQAYRGFLGRDIAKLEGLFPIPNEPQDYDAKGVNDQDTCRICHATLDPLSYPFKNYNGLTGSIGEYEARRIENNFSDEGPRITQMPEQGYIFGQPVANLTEWARVAANSDEFLTATVMDYWKLLMGGVPRASEEAEFHRLWTELRSTHNYRVELMLRDLIKTEAYGVP